MPIACACAMSRRRTGVIQVVCGAPNARTGMTGIFAPAGAHIPGTGVDLEKGVIRGVESNGMLCSERELLISQDHDGIIDLEGDFAIGTPAAVALGLDDPMIYIKVTPNRPDALGRLRHCARSCRQGTGKAESHRCHSRCPANSNRRSR